MEQWLAAKAPVKLGAIAPGDGTYDTAKILEATLNLPLQIVTGYKGNIVRGNNVTVNWNGIVSPSATDWIGLYQVGAANNSFWEWQYVSGTKTPTTAKVSGTCTFPIPVNPPVGNFNLQLFSNNGFTLLATSTTIVLQ